MRISDFEGVRNVTRFENNIYRATSQGFHFHTFNYKELNNDASNEVIIIICEVLRKSIPATTQQNFKREECHVTFNARLAMVVISILSKLNLDKKEK